MSYFHLILPTNKRNPILPDKQTQGVPKCSQRLTDYLRCFSISLFQFNVTNWNQQQHLVYLSPTQTRSSFTFLNSSCNWTKPWQHLNPCQLNLLSSLLEATCTAPQVFLSDCVFSPAVFLGVHAGKGKAKQKSSIDNIRCIRRDERKNKKLAYWTGINAKMTCGETESVDSTRYNLPRDAVRQCSTSKHF